MTLLETKEDMEWLAEIVSDRGGPGNIVKKYPCAIIHGNEDSPTKIELYAENHHKCKPTVLLPDEDGIFRVNTWGNGLPTE